MPPAPARLAPVVALLVAATAAPASASRSFSLRDRPGGPAVPEGVTPWSERATPDHGAFAARPGRVVLRVDGEPVTLAEYRDVLEEGADTWRLMMDLPGNAGPALARGLTREEVIFIREYAEPKHFELLFQDQVPNLTEEAWAMYERARAGESWWPLVAKYTHEPPGLRRPGDAGLVTLAALPNALARVVFTAPLSEVQPPVQTVFGWHVAKVLEIVPATADEPEQRHLSQAVFMYDPGGGEEAGIDMRMFVWSELRDGLVIDVVDPALCNELPLICEENARREAGEDTAPPLAPESGR